MDLYDESPLNKAHYFSYKADLLTKKGDFDAASEFHEKAAVLLVEALKLTNNKLAIESIELQKQYHIRSQQILQLKKLQQKVIIEAAKVEKEVFARTMRTARKSESEQGGNTLQTAIYRTFDEADSLLEILGHRKELESIRQASDSPTPSSSNNNCSGIKKPKDDSTIIEELRIVNFQLRNLIKQLMSDLADREKQVEALKQKVTMLESAREFEKNGPKFLIESEEIPELPPLDLPSFKIDLNT